MDGNERRGTQYGPPYHTPVQARPSATQSMGPPGADRYATQMQSPARTDVGSSSGSLTRPYMTAYSGYGYQGQQYAPGQLQSSSPMQGIEIQYPGTYMQDPGRQSSIQQSPSHSQYPGYGQAAMLPPVAPQSVYESLPHYQQRQSAQSAAIEVMASQFSMPQYLPSNEQAVPLPSQYVTQGEPTNYPAVVAPRGSVASYGAGVYSSLEQQESTVQQATGPSHDALREGMSQYQQQIRSVIESITASRLTEASERLLHATRWLLGSAVALGLHHDDESKHAERLIIWRQFNLAWEALGQRQLSITDEALRTGVQPPDMLSAETIRNLLDELIGLTDQVEPHALVDYELGVWEEQIVNIFLACLDSLARGEDVLPGTGSKEGRGG